MTNPRTPLGDPDMVQEIVASVTAARAGQRYALATIVLAIAKQGGIDLDALYKTLRPLADGFAQTSKTATSPMMGQALAIAAEELAALEPTITNMLTIPPGAGRA